VVIKKSTSFVLNVVDKCIMQDNMKLKLKYRNWRYMKSLLYPNWIETPIYDSDWYDDIYQNEKSYHVNYKDSPYYLIWKEISDRISNNNIVKVLDIGCGPGQFAALLLDNGVTNYTGLDFSSTAIDIAKINCKDGNFIIGDAKKSDVYETVQYEAIVCTEVLEHIDDDLAVIARFPTGIHCFCTVPNFSCNGHVRFFNNENEVRDRYNKYFSSFSVVTLSGKRFEDEKYFLIDGIRN